MSGRRTPTQFRDPQQVSPARFEQAHAANEWRREETRREQWLAEQRSLEMANKEVSPTGIVRESLNIDGANAALGELNRALGEALDDLERGRQRSKTAETTKAARRNKDARRAPALKGRG